MFYEPPGVVLVDRDPIIVAVWQYLIRATPAEILALPDVVHTIDEHPTLPQEARWFIGFWLNRGGSAPKLSRTAFSSRVEKSQLVWGPAARQRVAAQVDRIRHWRMVEGSYAEVDDMHATWFVDPPYVEKGRYYRFKNVDYAVLASWCQGRSGRTIVCENAGASWLPFQPLASVKSTKGVSVEVAYLQEIFT